MEIITHNKRYGYSGQDISIVFDGHQYVLIIDDIALMYCGRYRLASHVRDAIIAAFESGAASYTSPAHRSLPRH